MSRFDFQEPNRNVFAALPDYLAYRIGLRDPRDPVAVEMSERAMTLPDILRHVTGAGRDVPIAIVADRALGMDDLRQSLVTAAGTLATGQFNLLIAWMWNLVRRIPVATFRPVRPQAMSADGFVVVPEHGEIPYSGVQVDEGLESSQLETLGALRNISRQAIINDDIGAISAQIDAIVAAANLQMMTSLAATLESTATLSDSLAFFNSTSGNLISTGSAPSVTSLDEATTKLYRATRPKGGTVCALPKYLLIPPELLATGRTLVSATFDYSGSDIMGGNLPSGQMGLAVLPFSNTKAWYVLADPAVEPAIAILTLQGAASPLLIESRPTPISRDGVSYRASLDFKVTRLSRYGALKNPGQ